MKPRAKQYLDYSKWPAVDKGLWQAAFMPGTDLFDDGGPGSHLSERTIWQLRYTYGKFLHFLATEQRDLLKRAPVERINTKTIESFVNSQPVSCGGVTVSIYLFHLWLALSKLYPTAEWAWLLRISNRIKARARPRPERHHLVTSEKLYDLGIGLMDAALCDSKSLTSSQRVRTAFRDGLIIALLAMIPLRRRTLTALRIGKQLVRSGERWVLDIPAADIKTKRPLEFPISAELSQRIDFYLNQIRPQGRGAGTHDHLWMSGRGRPMGGQVIYYAVRRRTFDALGFPVNLQRFRSAAATFWSSSRSIERARRQGSSRACIICYDREALHHGTVASCGARSRSRRRRTT